MGGGGGPMSHVDFKKWSCPFPANKARIFTSSAHVNLVENWCKEYFRVLSVFFNRQILVFTEKHILVIFNIYIIFFIISILGITNYIYLGDINVL